MKKAILLLVLLTSSLFAIDGKKMQIYKSPSCGCCSKWADIMKSKGFEVNTIKSNNMNQIKQRLGVSPQNASCHTAVVDGYIIEGHVNYSEIKKMLIEKPKIKGLSVPGMPIGSPGMEQGHIKQKYNVVYINNDGSSGTYKSYTFKE